MLCLSCKKSIDLFIGKWKIIEVVENENVIPLQENWIHLKPNGTFESYDGYLKKNEKGTWKYESKNKKLFIDAPGDKNDSDWRIELKNDTLYFQSIIDDSYLVSIKKE